jgi:integrase
VPKTKAERDIGVSGHLIELLRDWKKQQVPGTQLVFPTRVGVGMKRGRNQVAKVGNRPNKRFLETTKRIAFRAGLNCGHCYGWVQGPRVKGKPTRKQVKCSGGPVCEKWHPHKFRATYITELLRSGIDIRTVQALAGHAHITSTEKYLRPLDNDQLTGLIEAGSLARLSASVEPSKPSRRADRLSGTNSPKKRD